MRIAFIDAAVRDYTPETPLQRPLGGMQSGLCYLATELAARGHSVSLFNNTRTPGVFNGVQCSNFNGGRAPLGDADAIISISNVGAKLRREGFRGAAIYWTGHDVDQAAVQSLAQEAERGSWTSLAFKSEWQRRRFVEHFSIDPARTTVLRNAASPSFATIARRQWYFFEQQRAPILAYTSTPFRGLRILARAVPMICRAVPEATARVYSSLAVYGKSAADDDFGRLYDLCRNTSGIDYVGSVDQRTLATALSEADVLAYPSMFAETACISFMEAASAGCLIVSTDLGALPETGSGFAHLMPFSGRNLDFRDLVVEYARYVVGVIRSAYENPAEFRKKLDSQVNFFQQNYTWEKRAAEWESLLEKTAR